MDEITLEDFTEESVEGDPVKYLMFTDGEIQICLEPCAGGMCVGIYDGDNWILAPKLCTGYTVKMPRQTMLDDAVVMANRLYKEWKKKNVIE